MIDYIHKCVWLSLTSKWCLRAYALYVTIHNSLQFKRKLQQPGLSLATTTAAIEQPAYFALCVTCNLQAIPDLCLGTVGQDDLFMNLLINRPSNDQHPRDSSWHIWSG